MLIIRMLLLVCAQTYAEPPAFTVDNTGSGQPVFFLPGFATPGEVWLETANALPPGYEKYFFTYAGFGGREAIAMPWYAKIRDALIAYIREENLTNLYLVGHSMGGNLATEIAAQLPQRVDKLVLLDALPCMREVMMPGVPIDQLTYDSPYNRQMLQMEADAFHQNAQMMAAGMTRDSIKAQQLCEWMVLADRSTFVYGYTDLLRLDLRNQLARVQAPVLILGASLPDRQVALRHFAQQYASLRDKKMLMAPDSRHFIMWDAPDWLVAQLTEFLHL